MASYAAATISVNNNTVNNSTVIDHNHPYYLQTSNNSGTPLVTQLLTDQNYYQGSRSVSIALSAKMKLGMIDESLPKSLLTASTFDVWSICNDMVISWLLNSMTVEIRNRVAYFVTAEEIRDDLAIRFSQSNMPRVFQLRKDLGALCQGTMTIIAYFTRFRTLIAEIENLNPMPKCSCVTKGCNCDNAHKPEKYENTTKFSQFLMELHDQYTHVRGQLLMMQPIPTISQVFSLLIQEESQRELAKSFQSPLADTMALTVKYNNLAKYKSNAQTSSSAQKR